MDDMRCSTGPKRGLASVGRTVWVVALRGAAAAALMLWATQQAGAQQRRGAPERPEGPLMLSTVAQWALEGSRDVLDAQYQVAVAEEQASEAWAEIYPSVDLSSSYTRNVAPQVSFLPAQIFDPDATEGEFIPVQFGADNIWNLSINADQAVFDARSFFGLGGASQFQTLQREGLRGRTQQVVTRVRDAFYRVLLGQEEVRLTERSISRVRQSLEETAAMERAGLASSYDVLRLEVELANLTPSVRRARNRHEAARRSLALELGIDPETALDVAGELARIDLDDFDANTPANKDILAFAGDVVHQGGGAVTRLVDRAMAHRSDIRQLELQEDLRQVELRLEQVAYLPTVRVFGTYGLAAQQNGPVDFFGSAAQRGSSKQVGVSVNFPIFSGLSRDARIDQRRASLRQAEVQTRRMAGEAEAELRNLADELMEAHARASSQRLAISQAQRGYEIASAQYREGIGSQLELTDAEVSLRQSEFNYAQAVYDYLWARARLDQARGEVPLVDIEYGGADAPKGRGE